MAYYDYKCLTCDVEVEVSHSMNLLKDLSDEELDRIRCKTKYCANKGEIMTKQLVNIHLGWSSGGTTGASREVLKKKQAERKLRSKRHFKHEVLPTLNETPKIMDHFNKKFKDI